MKNLLSTSMYILGVTTPGPSLASGLIVTRTWWANFRWMLRWQLQAKDVLGCVWPWLRDALWALRPNDGEHTHWWWPGKRRRRRQGEEPRKGEQQPSSGRCRRKRPNEKRGRRSRVRDKPVRPLLNSWSFVAQHKICVQISFQLGRCFNNLAAGGKKD